MKTISSDYHALSIAERIQLVEDIWDSIAEESPESIEISLAQKKEIGRRIAAHDADPSSAIPWEIIRAELLQQK